eukprot:358056-Chlamydomonas_euryale.AAC.2
MDASAWKYEGKSKNWRASTAKPFSEIPPLRSRTCADTVAVQRRRCRLLQNLVRRLAMWPCRGRTAVGAEGKRVSAYTASGRSALHRVATSPCLSRCMRIAHPAVRHPMGGRFRLWASG